jgi:peptidylprolyl isomerase
MRIRPGSGVASRRAHAVALLVSSWITAVHAAEPPKAADPPKSPTTADVLAASQPSEWRALDPDRTLYMELPSGRVVIELAPEFAPKHVANLRTLVAERFFDGLAVVRVQDGFVVQWGDPDSKRSLGTAATKLAPEYERPSTGLPFTKLPDGDVYAPEVGWSGGFAVGRDPAAGTAWLAHCYGAVGVGRDLAPDSGNAAELYAVIGHAPRQLDRNITTIGRVVQGFEKLTALARGTEAMGFYATPVERTPIRAVRFASEVPAAERTDLEVLRTDSKTFDAFVESRRNRRDAFYQRPAGHIDLCSVQVPVRVRNAKPAIAGTSWQWVTTIDPVRTWAPADPSRYTLTLGAGGDATVRADCNRGRGTYTLAGESLQLGPVATTKMLCPEAKNLDSRYLTQLGAIRSVAIVGGLLRADLVADSGTMFFAAEPDARFVAYRCNRGQTAEAIYTDGRVRLLAGPHLLDLKRAESASGARYTTASATWFTKGNDAWLENGGRRVLTGCRASPAR